MERTQVYLTTEQRERLSTRGKRLGKTMADLIREAIDRYVVLADGKDEDADALLELVAAGKGLDSARDVSSDHHRYLRREGRQKPRRK